MATRRLTPTEKFNEEWGTIESGFRRMLDCLDKSKNVPPQDRLDIYSAIISAVQVSRLETVFEKSRQMVETYLKEQASEELAQLEGIDLLGACFKAWQRHQIVVRWMTCVFGYIEDVATKRQQSGQDSGVRKMTLRCFYTGLYMAVKGKLRKVLLDQVHSDREGGIIDRDAVKNCVDLFVQMGLDDMPVYETELQAAYLEDVEQFFRARTAQWLSEPDGVITFPERAERTIIDEQKRVRELLHPSSEPHVMKAVETEILRKNQDRILNDPNAGLKALLIQWKEGDLGRLFRVFGATAVNEMAQILREHVKLEGGELNQKLCNGEVDGKGYVEEALAIYKRYSTLLRTNFTNESSWEAMSKALREAFEVFMNATLMVIKKAPGGSKDPKKDETKVKVTSAELVSTYFDNLLTGGQKNEGSEIESLLDDATQLFVFVAEKDLFQEFYRNQLSKRLLQDKSSDEDERTAISKLKLKMGAPFTSKMEGMLNDKNHNEELMKKFRNFCSNRGWKNEVDFTAQVLTTGHWPSFKVDEIEVPEVLKRSFENFGSFYQNDAQSKKLKWVHCLGTATVSGKFKKGQKEFMVSTYQACILLQFNEKDKYTLADLLTITKLGDSECRAAIASLALSKTQVLKKVSGAPKKIDPSDEFQFNDDFSDPRRKIKIPVAITTSTATPVEKTDEARRHVTDACIVRIMKARKQMAHGELQAECLRQLTSTFRPDPKLIKKRIEDLINRQYLERDTNDHALYRYLA